MASAAKPESCDSRHTASSSGNKLGGRAVTLLRRQCTRPKSQTVITTGCRISSIRRAISS
jgi:hypothetical protein